MARFRLQYVRTQVIDVEVTANTVIEAANVAAEVVGRMNESDEHFQGFDPEDENTFNISSSTCVLELAGKRELVWVPVPNIGRRSGE